jgi:hypothetical protein
MEREQKTPITAYEAGIDFYERKLTEIAEKFEKEEITNDLEAIELTEESEILTLKMNQLERRHRNNLIK